MSSSHVLKPAETDLADDSENHLARIADMTISMNMSWIRKDKTLVGRTDKCPVETLKVNSNDSRIDPEISRFPKPDSPAYEYKSLYENADVDRIRRDLADSTLPRSFRLLILAPGTENDVVECSLERHDFEETELRYEALSYAWESSQLEVPMLCCGKYLLITKSLHSALRHLRYKDKSRTLWADAICINQNDANERNHQVTLMRDVYSRATAVLVWLGEPKQRDCNAFDVIRRLKSMLPPLDKHKAVSLAGSREALVEVLTSKLLLEDEWMHLLNLFERGWFRRLWVSQEFALARDVFMLYGHEAITLEAMETVVRIIISNKDELRIRLNLRGQGLMNLVTDFRRLLSLRRGYKTYSTIRLLTNVEGKKCSNDRDQIYGILGLAKTSVQQAIPPDYTADVLKVYRTFAVYNLFSERSLNVLSCCLYRKKFELTSAWPSWVCDWRRQRYRPLFLGDENLGFHAAGSSIPNFSIVEESNVLSIQGRAVETVSAVSSALRTKLSRRAVRGLDSEGIYSIKRTWLHECFYMVFGGSQHLDLEILNTPAAQPFLCSLIVGVPHQFGKLRILNKAYLDDFATLLQDFMSLKDSAETPTEMATAVDLCLVQIEKRFVCVMSSGRLGALPEQARLGDIVCVLDGGAAPFVLRDDGDGYHRLIGECYVHGIMHGEAMKMEGVVIQNFKIR